MASVSTSAALVAVLCLTAFAQAFEDGPLLLLEPSYRGWIFPESPLVRMAFEGAGDRVHAYSASFARDGQVSLAWSGQASGEIIVDTTPLEPADYSLEVTVDGGEAQVFRLRVLGAENARGIAAHVDRHGRLVWRGKPRFVNGWYSDGNVERLRRIAKSPFNAVLDYGLTGRPIEETRRYLDEAATLGVAVILCVNDVYPSAKHRAELGPWKGNSEVLEGLIGSLRDHPAAIAWYTNDELPFELAGEARGQFERIAALDPARPQLAVHFKTGGIRQFERAADILGIDRYPIPKSSVLEVATAVDDARSELTAPRPVWAVIQDFAWYQHHDPDRPILGGDAASERARLPTPEEWKVGRPPTLDEVRAMTYLALIHGAKGLLYWCLYNLEYLPDREERWKAACTVGEEVRELEPALLAPIGGRAAASDERIHVAWKVAGLDLFVIAINSSTKPVRATIEALVGWNGVAEVVFERRTMQVKDGALTDFFPPLARHVYRLKGQ